MHIFQKLNYNPVASFEKANHDEGNRQTRPSSIRDSLVLPTTTSLHSPNLPLPISTPPTPPAPPPPSPFLSRVQGLESSPVPSAVSPVPCPPALHSKLPRRASPLSQWPLLFVSFNPPFLARCVYLTPPRPIPLHCSVHSSTASSPLVPFVLSFGPVRLLSNIPSLVSSPR